MKKYIIYSGILVVGLLLGWLFFGNSSAADTMHKHSEISSETEMWTCSMHPQIMQQEAGACPICGMDLIPAEVGVTGLNPDEFKLSENATALANIQTAIVGGESENKSSIKLSGIISENEDSNVVQASYFSGRIEELHISSVGDDVKKGELLATIYSPELFSAQQELITASALKESQAELYKAVRNKLKFLKLTDSQINQIEASGAAKQYYPIYANVAGTVSEKLIEQGDFVKQGQPLLKIANLNTVWALFDVYENQIEQFKQGQQIEVTTKVYPNKVFKKKVDFIDPVMNPQTRTVKLRVVLNNKEGEFKTGMFVEGDVQRGVSEEEQILMIPSSAVLWTGKRSLVYLKTNPEQPIFKMQEITIGQQIGEQYEVLDGLERGDEIVTNGTFTVDASAQLKGKKSMMNKKGGKTSTGHEGHTMEMGHTTEKIEFDGTFEKSFRPVVNAYIGLKDALIQSDVEMASNKTRVFRTALEAIPENQRQEPANYWSFLYKASEEIIGNTNLEDQRKQFQLVSAKLIEMIKNFDELETIFYVQYCPMADNNRGASWISKEQQILNPYFGDVMLKCGRVEEIIQ